MCCYTAPWPADPALKLCHGETFFAREGLRESDEMGIRGGTRTLDKIFRRDLVLDPFRWFATLKIPSTVSREPRNTLPRAEEEEHEFRTPTID